VGLPMGSDRPFKPIKYVCPICGMRTTFGTHFCKGEAVEEDRPPLSAQIKRIAAAIIAVLVIEVLLWGMIGIYSLYALAIIPLVAAIILAIRGSKAGDKRGGE
jgi:hypothetical protein